MALKTGAANPGLKAGVCAARNRITKKQAIEEFLEQGGAIRIGFKTYGKGDPYP
jgi:hypothetical protein